MSGSLGVTFNNDTAEVCQLAAAMGAQIKPITLKSGAGNLRRGAVVAFNTTTNLWTALDPTGSDGENVACGLLAEDTDASSGQKKATAYVQGKFRAADLIWPAGISQTNKYLAIRNLHDFGLVLDVAESEAALTTTTTTTSTTTSTSSTTTTTTA